MNQSLRPEILLV